MNWLEKYFKLGEHVALTTYWQEKAERCCWLPWWKGLLDSHNR